MVGGEPRSMRFPLGDVGNQIGESEVGVMGVMATRP
jgi:hypothetical protein